MVPLQGRCMGSGWMMVSDSGIVTFPYEQVLKRVLTEGLGPLVLKSTSFTRCSHVSTTMLSTTPIRAIVDDSIRTHTHQPMSAFAYNIYTE
jgi:hypothetical protein